MRDLCLSIIHAAAQHMELLMLLLCHSLNKTHACRSVRHSVTALLLHWPSPTCQRLSISVMQPGLQSDEMNAMHARRSLRQSAMALAIALALKGMPELFSLYDDDTLVASKRCANRDVGFSCSAMN